jgi:hypothetical protein
MHGLGRHVPDIAGGSLRVSSPIVSASAPSRMKDPSSSSLA